MTNYFFVKHNGVLTQVDISKVHVLEANNNYVKMFLPGEYCIVRGSLASLLERLPANEFVQVHRTWAVALRHVQKIDKEVVTIGGGEIPIARRFHRGLMKAIVVLGSGGEEKEGGGAAPGDDGADTTPDRD
jgi:DNA-binding LytR/AlgR family response regulator